MICDGNFKFTVNGNSNINLFQSLLDKNNYLNVRCKVEVNEVAEYVNYFFYFHSVEEREMIKRELQDIIDECNYITENGGSYEL